MATLWSSERARGGLSVTEPPRRPGLVYERAPFVAKLDDETYRSSRYSIPLSIVFVRFDVSRSVAGQALHEHVVEYLRRLDFAGRIGDTSYVICLPHTPVEGAEAVAGRLRLSLLRFSPLVGVAGFPQDGEDAEGLLLAAERHASERADSI